MGQRTVGIDLAIRGDHVARIFDDGRPHAKPVDSSYTQGGTRDVAAA